MLIILCTFYKKNQKIGNSLGEIKELLLKNILLIASKRYKPE